MKFKLKYSRKTIPQRIVNKIKNAVIYRTASWRNKQLAAADWTIISNNCWGGRISKTFGVRYNSPTVGLSIMSDDYIIFLQHLEGFLASDVKFVKPENAKWREYYEKTKRVMNYPIGQIFYDGQCVELSFINYQTEKEVRMKWNRRKKRVNPAKMLVKMSEQNDFSEQNLRDFLDLNYRNKICFVNSPYSGLEVYRTATYTGDIDIEDEPKLKVGDEKMVNILNHL